jgi:hypothetical protein
MPVVVEAVRFAMAGLLLLAGLEKAASLPAVTTTLRQLGISHRAAPAAGPVLVAVELTAALGLIFRPGSAFTLGGVLLLSVAFAAAGLIALRRDVQIRCACFGVGRDTMLGTRQLVALPFWLAAVALIRAGSDAGLSAVPAAPAFAALALTLALARGITALAAARTARGDRRSAEEMYVWLRR